MNQPVIYAIGDIHGELDRLRDLHARIMFHHERLYSDRSMTLIHLGDFVDRGPDSAGVLELLIEMEARDDINVINLRGNHEQMMIEAYGPDKSEARLHWLINGGDETIGSYGRRGREHPPQAHLDWAKNLDTIHMIEDQKLAFVHAGVEPRTFPDSGERVHMWTRSKRFFDPSTWRTTALDGWTVVHGHTPTRDFQPDAAGTPVRRYNLDTGAVYGGKLTAGVFAGPDEPVHYLFS
ncbi:metallophosphoesterase family protein [Henriciella litoralis]|uniref:metallophosphoesterase family protein n=1 Tax=Henriciella litoralis TaxID=568102 RepID=UPI00146E5EC2|nr:metallophosphoesterase family protein [Henriciella litoralis]